MMSCVFKGKTTLEHGRLQIYNFVVVANDDDNDDYDDNDHRFDAWITISTCL